MCIRSSICGGCYASVEQGGEYLPLGHAGGASANKYGGMVIPTSYLSQTERDQHIHAATHEFRRIFSSVSRTLTAEERRMVRDKAREKDARMDASRRQRLAVVQQERRARQRAWEQTKRERQD